MHDISNNKNNCLIFQGPTSLTLSLISRMTSQNKWGGCVCVCVCGGGRGYIIIFRGPTSLTLSLISRMTSQNKWGWRVNNNISRTYLSHPLPHLTYDFTQVDHSSTCLCTLSVHHLHMFEHFVRSSLQGLQSHL